MRHRKKRKAVCLSSTLAPLRTPLPYYKGAGVSTDALDKTTRCGKNTGMAQELFSWNIVVHQPKAAWIPLALASVLLWGVAVYFGTTANFFGSALFALFPVLLVAQRFSGPRAVRCVMREDGVEVNGSRHLFKEYASFAWVHNEEFVLNRKTGGAVHVPFYAEDGDKVEEVLVNALPEGEHEEDFSEIVSRFLRLS